MVGNAAKIFILPVTSLDNAVIIIFFFIVFHYNTKKYIWYALLNKQLWNKYYYKIWNAYNIYMNCHTYQHFHMFLFHTINGRIFSTLINTRVTSLYFRHIDFDTTCSLLINHSYCAHTQRNLYKTIIKH